MFYRRKVLLALLELFNNNLEKIQLQKLLLLFCQMQQKPVYHFVPYKYGCFSFQANADLATLTKSGIIKSGERNYEKISNEFFFNLLTSQDKNYLEELRNSYSGLTSEELIRATYLKFPYYAIKSKILNKVLSEEEIPAVVQYLPKNNNEITLYTIGYEGLSLEEYLNKLLENNVKVLCDVRKNSFSMKYGFSKSQLQHACEGLNIVFLHLPNLGIESASRKNLNTQKDRDSLFDEYCRNTLPNVTLDVNNIISFLRKYQKVALTCFESLSCECHRSHLALEVLRLANYEFKVVHL